MSGIQSFRIAVIPGDGIGQEVTQHGVNVLNRIAEHTAGKLAFSFESFPWGCDYYKRTGRMMDRGWTRPPARIRRDLLRRGRLAGGARSRQSLGIAAGDLPGVRPVRLRPAGPLAARHRESASRAADRDDRLGRRARKHGRRIRRRRRAQFRGRGDRQRSCRPSRDVHRAGLRADHPLRLRTGRARAAKR